MSRTTARLWRYGLLTTRGVLLLVFSQAIFAGAVHAHNLGQSYIFLKVYDDAMEGRFELTLADLNKALPLALPTDGTATLPMLEPRLEEITRYVLAHSTLRPDGVERPVRITGHGLFGTTNAQYLTLDFVLDGIGAAPAFVDIGYRVLFDVDPEHRNLVVVEHNWKTATFNNEGNVSLILEPAEPLQRLDLSDASIWRGFVGLVKLGTHHIWIGIDHILFLLALLLPSVVRRQGGRWVPVDGFRPAIIHVVKIVTLFTIAHTITLSLAALGVVDLSSRVVESIIAISIAVAALDVLVPVFGRRIWLIVFGFGLFHGFGFASVLGDIGLGRDHLTLSLLGFNVGVEIGQVVIVCLIFPVLYLLRNAAVYTRLLMPAGGVLLILVAMYWFIERAFEVDLPAGYYLNRLLSVFG